MDVGWNFRREHLRLAQRSHYVITNGGDQPNVVPPNAAVWYYFREADYDHIMDMWRIGDNMAKAATLMTDTTYTSRLLGSAWPGHFNKPIAEAMYENIKKVGLPQWSEDDQTLAKALQTRAEGAGARPRHARFPNCAPPRRRPRCRRRRRHRQSAHRRRLRRYRRRLLERADRDAALSRPTFPAARATTGPTAIAMATPIAHKGVIAGAKVQAMTMLDILLHPELVDRTRGTTSTTCRPRT